MINRINLILVILIIINITKPSLCVTLRSGNILSNSDQYFSSESKHNYTDKENSTDFKNDNNLSYNKQVNEQLDFDYDSTQSLEQPQYFDQIISSDNSIDHIFDSTLSPEQCMSLLKALKFNIINQDAKEVYRLLKSNPQLLYYIDYYKINFSPLKYAIDNNNAIIIQILIGFHNNKNQFLKNGVSLLAYAIHLKKSINIIKLFLENGSDPNFILKNDIGSTALHVAANCNYPLAIKLLYQSGATVDYINNNGVTPLHIAIAKKNINSVQALIECKAKIDITSPEYDTSPYMLAEIINQKDILNILKRKPV